MLDRPSAEAIQAIDSSETGFGAPLVFLRADLFGGSVGLISSSNDLPRSNACIDNPAADLNSSVVVSSVLARAKGIALPLGRARKVVDDVSGH